MNCSVSKKYLGIWVAPSRDCLVPHQILGAYISLVCAFSFILYIGWEVVCILIGHVIPMFGFYVIYVLDWICNSWAMGPKIPHAGTGDGQLKKRVHWKKGGLTKKTVCAKKKRMGPQKTACEKTLTDKKNRTKKNDRKKTAVRVWEIGDGPKIMTEALRIFLLGIDIDGKI